MCEASLTCHLDLQQMQAPLNLGKQLQLKTIKKRHEIRQNSVISEYKQEANSVFFFIFSPAAWNLMTEASPAKPQSKLTVRSFSLFISQTAALQINYTDVVVACVI